MCNGVPQSGSGQVAESGQAPGPGEHPLEGLRVPGCKPQLPDLPGSGLDRSGRVVAAGPPVRGHCLVCACGSLTPEGRGRARLDFGDGELVLISDDEFWRDKMAHTSRGSIVTVSGHLRPETWTVGDGTKRESLHLIVANMVTLYDARRGRMRV